MKLSFYIGDAFFNGFAKQVSHATENVFLVELDNQVPFYARITRAGNWTSDHTKGNKMIYDMVCAAGTEITYRMQLPDPDNADPGSYETGCGLKDCPAQRNFNKAPAMN